MVVILNMRNRKNVRLTRNTKEVLTTLALMIDIGRKNQQWTQNELAERLSVSRHTVQHLLKGDPGIAIGTVLEAAVLTGVPLWQPESANPVSFYHTVVEKAALLPSRVRKSKVIVDDNF